jgi:hypothetical protein
MNPHPPHPNHSPYPLPPPGQHPHPHHPQQQHHDYQQTAAAALSSAPPPHQQQQHQQQHQPALSQQHVPTPNNTAAPNGRKRKAGQPGSRGVANLTPEQLAKKRANDREAQRAIRERTKNTIEGLEARIRELESQQPYQELQRALADRDRAQQECEELRTRLAAVAGIVGNRELGQTGLNGMISPTVSRDLLANALLTPDGAELAALTAQQSPLPSTAGHSTPANYPHHQPPPVQQYEHAPVQQHLHPDLRSPNTSSTADSPAGAPSHYQASEPSVRKWSPSVEPQTHQTHQQYPSHSHSYEQQRPAPAAQMQQQNESNGERLGVSFLCDQQQHSSPLNKASNIDEAAQILSRHNMTCPLDYLLGDFIKTRRAQLASGIPLSQVIGPERPSLISMIHPEAKRSAADCLTPLLLDILSKFPDIDRDPERLAVLYGMYYVTRWFLCPCETCLDHCLPWCRPVPEARENTHPPWIDYLPWPTMRRKLILARTPGTRINFDDFFVTFTYTMSINWPYPQASCLTTTPSNVPGEPPVVELSAAFIEHIRRLDNWSIGPEFAQNFPELIDEQVRVVERKKSPPR